MKLLILTSSLFLTGALAKTMLSDIGNLNTVCSINTDIAPTYIGADKNVIVQVAECPLDLVDERAFGKRQTNECGATCATNCFPGSSGGPVASDCTVIADALLYENQNTGSLFTIPTGTTGNPIVMTYNTCETFYIDQSNVNQTYCRDDWASLVTWLTSDCSASNGAHGGNCVATDGTWFIQVQSK